MPKGEDRNFSRDPNFTHKTEKPKRRSGESTREYNERISYWERTQTKTLAARRPGETTREYNERKGYIESHNARAQRIHEDKANSFAHGLSSSRPTPQAATDLSGDLVGVSRQSARSTGAKIKLAKGSAGDTLIKGAAEAEKRRGRRSTPSKGRGVSKGSNRVGGL